MIKKSNRKLIGLIITDIGVTLVFFGSLLSPTLAGLAIGVGGLILAAYGTFCGSNWLEHKEGNKISNDSAAK